MQHVSTCFAARYWRGICRVMVFRGWVDPPLVEAVRGYSTLYKGHKRSKCVFLPHGEHSGARAPDELDNWGVPPRAVAARASAIAIVFTAASSAFAGIVAANAQPMANAAIEIDKSIAEVSEAIKFFEKRDFDACLKQLGLAVKAHPELPPPDALFAKVAFLGNQPTLIRPALERAVGQAPEHPEIYILFGNLALLENRVTDAALHFEKAKTLATAKRWTADQKQRFDRFCYQGTAQLAERQGRLEGRPYGPRSLAETATRQCPRAPAAGNCVLQVESARRCHQRIQAGFD